MKPFDGEARAQKVAGKVCSRSIDAARRAGLENQGAVRQRCRQHRCRDEAALEGSDVYEVDTLLEKRRRGGVVTYLVKWKGDRDQDSWEPVINIPRAIVREFEEERGPEEETDDDRDDDAASNSSEDEVAGVPPAAPPAAVACGGSRGRGSRGRGRGAGRKRARGEQGARASSPLWRLPPQMLQLQSHRPPPSGLHQPLLQHKHCGSRRALDAATSRHLFLNSEVCVHVPVCRVVDTLSADPQCRTAIF